MFPRDLSCSTSKRSLSLGYLYNHARDTKQYLKRVEDLDNQVKQVGLPNLEDKILKDLRARHSVSTCSNQSFQKSERRKALALNWVAQTVFLIELRVILVSFFSENFPESTSWIF